MRMDWRHRRDPPDVKNTIVIMQRCIREALQQAEFTQPGWFEEIEVQMGEIERQLNYLKGEAE